MSNTDPTSASDRRRPGTAGHRPRRPGVTRGGPLRTRKRVGLRIGPGDPERRQQPGNPLRHPAGV